MSLTPETAGVIITAIVGGVATVIAAVVKFVPKPKIDTLPGISVPPPIPGQSPVPVVCLEHSGFQQRFSTQEILLGAVSNRLDSMDKTQQEMQRSINEIHTCLIKKEMPK